MKLYNKFVSLFLVSPVFSMNYIKSPISEFVLGNSYNLVKRVEPTQEYEEAYIRCGKALINGYKDCIKNIDEEYMSEIESNCYFVQTKKCQDFYKEGLGIMKECQGDILKEDREVDQMLIDTLIAQYSYVCSKDEDGENCPHYVIVYNSLRNNTESTMPQVYEQQLYEVITDTCKSQTCKEEYIKLNKNLDEYDKKYEDYKNANKKLKEQKGKVDPEKVRNEKRSFHIENFSKVEKEVIREKTVEYLMSEECNQLTQLGNEERKNKKRDNETKNEDEDEEDIAYTTTTNIVLVVLLNFLLLAIM